MGARPSKINNTSAADSHSSVSKDSVHRQSQSCKDLADFSVINSEHSCQDDSQLTGDTSPGKSPSSKANLSSFLSAFRNKSKDKDATDSNNSSIQQPEKKGESDSRLNDLREQIEQKKINRINQKAKKQPQKHQPEQPLVPDAQFHYSSKSVSSILAPTSIDNSLRVISSKASSVNAAYISSKNSINSNLSAPATTVSPSHHRTILMALEPDATSPAAAAATVSQDYIRSKAGFGWLEKKLQSTMPSFSDNAQDDSAMGNQQDQFLDKMEMEAANGYFDRITDQHFLMKDVMGGNYHVPMDLSFKLVLENGCGAGDWTLDMSSEMPETDFIGCPQIVYTTSNSEKSESISRPKGLLGADLSQQGHNSTTSTKSLSPLIRPNIHPRNCNFHTEAPINRLPFPNEQFDFVYQRRQGIVLMATEWQRTILELFRVLKSGGWIEILEPDQFLRGGGELCQIAGEYCVALFESMGRNPNVVHEMPQLLKNAGFVNVEAKIWSIPVGWGGPIGQAMLVNQRQFVNELEPIYVRQGHGESHEFREITNGIFEEGIEKKAYINYHVFTAQKPASPLEKQINQPMQQQDLSAV
ncbi:hypothetical protein BGZ46_004845 [Entomortierella lignicola]|nr:hypothetical protein BGZ46_004845 [Entomortierella lignicola]